MCGLAFAFSKKGNNAGQQVMNLYDKQAHRGKQGYGFLSIHDGKLVGLHRAKSEVEIKKLLNADRSEFVMFHHRFPTSTKNTLGTTHPMFVSGKELEFDYYFAHNGIISNAKWLKTKHEKLGYVYETEHMEKKTAHYTNGNTELMDTETAVFNDSESLAIELARNIEGLDAKVNTFGPAAFWGISLKKGTNEVVDVFFGKNHGRDLCIRDNKKWYMVSSETGDDIRDMVIFRAPIKGLGVELYEQPLLIDEARPVVKVTPTYSRPADNVVGFRERPEVQRTHSIPGIDSLINSYENLENKYYKVHEVLDTGLPMSEFYPCTFHGRLYYLPAQFQGVDTLKRPAPEPYTQNQLMLLGNKDDERETEDRPDGKTKDLVDDYAVKIAKIETKVQLLETAFDNNTIDVTYYNSEMNKLEQQIDGLEDLISATGVSEDYLEEVLDVARQIEDYSNSSPVSDEDIEVIIDA